MSERAKKHDPEAHAFVLAVMGELGVTTPRQLAARLGVAKTDKETQVGRWVRGEHAPNFHYTIELLRLAEWLSPAALIAVAKAQAEEAAPSDQGEEKDQPPQIEETG